MLLNCGICIVLLHFIENVCLFSKFFVMFFEEKLIQSSFIKSAFDTYPLYCCFCS